MAGVYAPYKQKCLDSSAPDLTSTNIKLVLVDSADYTISLPNDDFLADIAAAGRVATSGNLASKTITGGVFDAADLAPAFTAVTGDVSEYVVGFRDTGTDTTSELLWINDSGTGLPVTPNGGDINVTFDSGASKIFRF